MEIYSKAPVVKESNNHPASSDNESRKSHGRKREGWGAKIMYRLSHDLTESFPDMKGISSRYLKYMRAFAAA